MRTLTGGKWKPATVMEKIEPRSYILRADNDKKVQTKWKSHLENRDRWRICDWNIRWWNDNQTSDENIALQDDTFTKMKREERVVDDANEQEDTIDISDSKKQIRSGRMPRRPKQYQDFELF